MLLASVPGLAQGPTADEIVNKNIEAHGGVEKMKALSSVKMTGKATVGQGIEVVVSVSKRRPGAFRMEMTLQGKTMVKAFDGTKGWFIEPFSTGSSDPQEMPADQAKEIADMADFDGPLFDYKSKGHTVEVVGKEDFEGTPAYKLKITHNSGKVSFVFIDADSFLELAMTMKRKINDQEIEASVTFGDYKPVNGVMIPHSIEQKAVGMPGGLSMVFESAEANTITDDSIFKMPANAPAPAPSK
jgi:hypothetical protein